MMKRVFFPAVWILLTGLLLAASSASPQSAAKPTLNADALVEEWMKRLNALDDWWITPDGKEEPEEVIRQMVDLFAQDAMLFVGPSTHQLGTVMYAGHKGIRKWADDFARTRVQMAFRLQAQTSDEQTAALVMSSVPPWGGLAAAAEFTSFYTSRETRRRYWGPGAAFFQFNDAGKITKLRIFVPLEETHEIVP